MIEKINNVAVVHWNPRSKRLPRPLSRFRFGKRINNFGDLLGPMIVRRILERKRFATTSDNGLATSNRLLAVGSILHFAQNHDVVWGAGVNGKEPFERLNFTLLDVRAVRGPRTARILEKRGIPVPMIYGDPAVLIPTLFPEFEQKVNKKFRKTAFVPNLNDEKQWGKIPDLVSTRDLPENVIAEILGSEQVITSSLHGLIIAEVYGIPVQLVESRIESEFKYRDWVEGTGRTDLDSVSSLTEAMKQIQNKDSEIFPNYDPKPLLEAFPTDLWE